MTIFWQLLAKIPDFSIFPQVTPLTHPRRHLGEDFRKFQAKTNDKNWSYKSKTFKNWIFGKIGHFLTVFGQKWPMFEFFSKIRLEHFFTLSKPYLTAKFQKKLMNGCLDMCVTDRQTDVHTHIQGSTYRSACGETKNTKTDRQNTTSWKYRVG